MSEFCEHTGAVRERRLDEYILDAALQPVVLAYPTGTIAKLSDAKGEVSLDAVGDEIAAESVIVPGEPIGEQVDAVGPWRSRV